MFYPTRKKNTKPSGYGQTAELHALMAHGASMGISRGVTNLLDELAEVKPTLLYAVPQLFKRVCDAIHAKVRADACKNKCTQYIYIYKCPRHQVGFL